MTRIPDAVAAVSLDTHRLIVTMPNAGPADVRSNLSKPTVAAILRHLADELTDEQPLDVHPGEALAVLTQRLTTRHYPADAARHAADALAHHTRELSNMLDAALDQGVPAEAPTVGRHLVSMLRSHAVRLDTIPRTAVDNLLDRIEARVTRRTKR
ncbi:hypothetical protein [Streptomyces antarcticus]|uniref:hypothetical protein n=1 Tax=Streptomyces antarcticus TaxID=2996458 RepID=UPI00226D7E15|nr:MULTISPECIES: hypothetical protein [unclassified Streptomyces]MCY0944648.1 hypothetical protein [Streptomyces sp. H34-AA3]MCZ4087805.1 hypothetical protein [Streptomyces sp. H34-S5]